MTVRSRRESRQISQTSSSVRFPHSRQKRTRSFTSRIASASASASVFDTWSRWNVSRCAVRVPIPGRRVSWATRFSTAGDSIAAIVPSAPGGHGARANPGAWHRALTRCQARARADFVSVLPTALVPDRGRTYRLRMGRGHRLQVPGGIYHVVTRGIRRQPIYLDHIDRERFLGLLAEASDRCNWRIQGYCLMTNHYHLIVQTPEPNISAGMHYVNNLHAKLFNRRYGHTGHLFEKRFFSEFVATDGD